MKRVLLVIGLLFSLLGVAAEASVVRLPGGDWGFPSPFAHQTRGPGSSKMQYIFDSMLERGERGPIPWLAERWDITETSYTFHIRPGVLWQDGQPLTASDVAFSFNYYRENPPVRIPDQVLDGDYLLSIAAKTSTAVRFEVLHFDAAFLEAVGRVPIIPKHVWEEVDNPYDLREASALIGSGPLKLTEYVGEHGTYRYEANPLFWGPRPTVTRLEFVPVSDPILALRRGDIAIASIPQDLVVGFEHDERYTLMERPGFWGYRLRFNMVNVPEFRVADVRRAFAFAIHRERLVELVARGAGVPGSMGILPYDHRWFNPDLPTYAHQPDLAKELLTNAGLLSSRYQLFVAGTTEVRIAELIREDLAAVGVQVDIVSQDSRSRDARIAEGSYELALVGHGGWGGDADYLRRRFYSVDDSWVEGTPGFEDELITERIWEQLYEPDEERRREIIYELQALIAAQVPEIPLYMTTGYDAFRNDIYDGWVHVYDHHATTHNKLSYVERSEL